MRRTPTQHSSRPTSPPRQDRWLVPAALPSVGLDPAIWSQRVHQVALWRLIEAWHVGRRVH